MINDGRHNVYAFVINQTAFRPRTPSPGHTPMVIGAAIQITARTVPSFPPAEIYDTFPSSGRPKTRREKRRLNVNGRKRRR